MKTKIILSVVTLLSINMCASATLIGHDGFDTAGTIAGQTGGAGFGWDNLNDVMTTTISDWDNTGGTPSVVAGQLITHGSSAKREYNGVLEGPGTNDAPNTERAGAFRGNGTVYYSVQMTRTTGADWSGLSGYDFGSEKVFFGVPGGQGAAKVFGVQVSGGGAKSLSTMSVV
ncbi:MAG: hypothetical protein HN350_12375, partial [Phycisphaerales bacterium]|nr:hypothetical protein [Phycisphaerales bacterium]